MFEHFFKNSCDKSYSSMDVRITKACDNACQFCIERDGLSSLGKTKDKEIIASINKSNANDILLLGGEPLLELKKVINIVENTPSDKKVYITTSLPKTILTEDYDDISIDMMYLMDMIDGLNISFHGKSDNENITVLNASSKHNRLPIIKRLAELYPDKVRVCINLVKGGVDNLQTLMSIVDMLLSYGVKKIKINELQHSPELYVSIEKILDRKWKSPYAYGCQTTSIYNNIEITYKRSCFLVEKSLNPHLIDFFKIFLQKLGFNRNKGSFSVCYENGKVYNGWMKEVN